MKEKIKYCTHCGRKHSRSNAMNLCRKHEWQLEKYGKYLDCNPRNKFDKNAYQIKDGKSVAIIRLNENGEMQSRGFRNQELEELLQEITKR